MEREHAFSESDVRLLQTLANSMSVALENARLFDETQRLFKESEQRAAELAIINSVQAALAAELNIQGIYDAVGDKIREIFQQRGHEHPHLRPTDAAGSTTPTPTRADSASTIASAPLAEKGFAAHVLRTRETLVINEDIERRRSRRYGSFTMPGTQDGEVGPLRSAGHRRAGARAHQPDRPASASTPSASPTSGCCRRSPTA